MNQLLRDDAPRPPSAEEDDPWRYGWRYVRRQLPDGTEVVDQVPLSWEDVLYPEEDDFVVQKPPHLRDFEYCHGALETFYVDQPSVVVLGDCRVDWGVAGVRALGPDILVLFEVRYWLRRGTFRIADEGGRPILVLEIASPSTRGHDLFSKPDLYYKAGVERYVIVDRGPDGEAPAQLLGYQRTPLGWAVLPPDGQGRLDLAPLPLLLGLEGDHPWFYEVATGRRLLDRTELTQSLAVAEKKVYEEAQARADLERKAREDAHARAEVERKAREELTQALAAAEKQVREEAEARAAAEKQAHEEARARLDAEAKAQREAEARAVVEKRVQELEDRLRQQGEMGGDAG